MKNIKIKLKIFLCFLFLMFLTILIMRAPTARAENISDLNVNKYVNDFANIISDDTERYLEEKLYNHFVSTTNQIVIVTLNNMNGDYIENYSIKLAEKIKAGSEKNDNGILFLVAKEERKVRFEVGYGLEGVITDSVAGQIIREQVTPEFKKENYDAGIKNGAEEIVRGLESGGASFTKSEAGQWGNSSFLKILNYMPAELILFFIFILFGVFQWIISVLARTKSWWLGGLIGFIISATIYFLLFTSLFVFLIAIFGFVLDYFVSKNYKEHANKIKDGPPDWWAGGSTFGGGGGWSSSSGGFGGGGGGFGGGGASGSW